MTASLMVEDEYDRYDAVGLAGLISKGELAPAELIETAISGIESMYASAMPVTRLVAPGPLVAMQTPALPLARA